MGLLDNCEKYFDTKDLYAVLGTEKSASEVDLKKAYKKLSLLCHPDKVTEDKRDEATRKFQVISQVHFILSDKEKRTVYDETGCIDEENADLQDREWSDYWRLLFPKLTKEKIDDFMMKYKGSDEEVEDIKKAYLESEGDMDSIAEKLMSYSLEDEERVINILKDLIEKDEIPDFPSFTKETKKKRNTRAKKFKSEAAEAEQMAKEMGLNDSEEALKKAILQRHENQFDDMIKNLEAKYGNKKSTRKKKA